MADARPARRRAWQAALLSRLSTGPVRNPAGAVVARFNSVWRLGAPGVWRVVFDKGQPADAPRP